LRQPFNSGKLDFRYPEQCIKKIIALGFSRIVYPYHSLLNSWEDLIIAEKWTKIAHKNKIELFLYTGPFGTEFQSFTEKIPESMHWLQTKLDGSVATYDDEGYLLMFCPLSPYLSEYRLPIVIDFIKHTACDGVFFDIPWVVRDACYCDLCKKVLGTADIDHFQVKEYSVRKALFEAAKTIRSKYSGLCLAANAAAPSIWNSGEVGATPASLCGIFDDLIVEWTPSNESEIKLIRESINLVRHQCPNSRISHAWIPENTGDLLALVKKMDIEEDVGMWTVDSTQFL
jgi:hypothetical protein